MDKEKLIKYLEEQIEFCDGVIKKDNFTVEGRKEFMQGNKSAFEEILEYVKKN